MAFLSEKLISASGGVQEATDDDFNLVTGLYHFDGSNGAQNNTFLDSSSNGFTVTKTGTIPQGTFSPFSADDGKWSIDAASGQSFVDVTNTSGDFQWGTGAFTIEGFVFMAGPNSVYGPTLIDERPASTNGAYVYLAIDTSQRLVMSSNSGSYYVRTTGDIRSDRIGKWTHFAFVRSSTSTDESFLFWNGNKVATGTMPTNFNATTVSRLGGIKWVTATNNRQNYYSNFRFLKGTALYTGSTYTIPTEPLTNITNTKLLTLQSNRLVDNSNNSNNSFTGNGSTTAIVPFSPFAPSAAYDAAVNGGSGYFDNDTYLTIADNSNLDISGAFTAEAWIYVVDFPDGNVGATGQGFVLTRWVASGNQRSWGIFLGNDGAIAAYVSTNGSSNYTGTATSSSGVIKKGSWHHVAQAWDGSTNRMLVDGVVVASTSTSTVNTAPNAPFTINALNTSLTGANQLVYISGARFVNNSALYTGSYTIPTAPPTAVSGTQALVNFTNAAMFDQTGKTNADTVGNAQLDTSVKKFGTASAEFDGTGDYLRLKPTTLQALGSGNFTVEFFLRATNVATTQLFIDFRNTSNTNTALAVYVSSGFKFYAGTSEITIGTISNNTWHHIAIVRNGSTITSYIDGTAGGTESNTNNLTCEKLTIGANWNTDYPMTGYIDELRITKSARYTSNFTAPTKEFSNL